MKLLHSFIKEIILATRSFYFYVEIIMASLFLFLLVFVVPEKFDNKMDEYLYYDVPAESMCLFYDEFLEIDDDHEVEMVEIEYGDETNQARLYTTESHRYYVLDNLDMAIGIANEEREFAGIIHMNDVGEISYTYYMQGYETERLINTYAVFHNEDFSVLEGAYNSLEVRTLHDDQKLLSDRQNIVPAMLTVNGSLMGLFIIASYVFLDKKEGVIKAYAVTPSPIWHYLLGKVGVVTITSLVTSLMITIPVMGTQPNYLVMILFLLASGFAASMVGLLLSSFYDDIVQSFGTMYVLLIALMLPNIAYFIPTWSPTWIQIIPTYSMLESFKEALLPNGDTNYILITSMAYFAAGLMLFLFTHIRFKKILLI